MSGKTLRRPIQAIAHIGWYIGPRHNLVQGSLRTCRRKGEKAQKRLSRIQPDHGQNLMSGIDVLFPGTLRGTMLPHA
jgi:hypothetical protein